MSSNRHRNMTGEQLHNPKGFDSASNNTTMIKDGSGSVLWTAQTDLPQALNIVSPQSAPPTENSGDVYLMDTTGTAYDINTITWQSGNTIRIAFNGAPDLSAVAADDYFVTSGNANSSNDGTFQISAVNDGSDYIDIINLNRSDATDDEATDAVGTGYYTLEEWDGVSKNMHVRFDGTSWISVTPSAGYTCYDITSGNILIYNGTDWSTTITTSGSASTLSEVLTAGNATGANNIDLATGQRVAYAADDNDDWVGISATGSTATLMAQGSGIPASATQIDLTKSTATITSTAGTFAGLQEASDYSANYSALSLVNKTYADALVSGLGTLSNVVEDTTPQLGGTLDANAFNIGFDDLTGIEDSAGNEMLIFNSNASAVNYLQINNSATGGNVGITALGTDTNINVNIQAKNAGNITLGNFTFDADQTVGAGQDNYVLTYDNASGLISLEASAGGGSSLWTDNGNRITDSNYYITEINKGVANTFNSATYTVGNLVIGDGNILGSVSNNMRGSLVFGETNTVGSTGSITDCSVIGRQNTLKDADYSVMFGYLNEGAGNHAMTAGYSNVNYGDNNIALGYNIGLNTSATPANYCYGFGKDVNTKANYQMAIGYGISSAFNTKPYIGFGLYASASGTQQPTAGFGIDPAGSANGAINFAMGGQNAFEDGIGINQNGAGNGIFYFHNYNNTRTVEPSSNIGNASAIWGRERAAGKMAIKFKSEDGTNHYLGDFSAIGGDETVANANKTLTIAGTGTTSGTSSLQCEDSAGTATLEVRDDGVVIMAGLPTSATGLPTGALWNNSGVINIV